MHKIDKDIKAIRIACISLAILTLFLVALGGFVRATGAGLACPDWPLCFGRVVPEISKPGVFQEVFHRFIAGLVSILTLVLSVFIFRRRNQLPRAWKLCAGLLVLLVLQIILGGLTVIMLLNPFIVTGHLALGTLFLLLVTMTAIERRKPKLSQNLSSSDKGFRTLIGVVSLLCFFQILLGGFVGSSGAALACPDIPFCNGEILPVDASGPQSIQMLHRGTGIALFLLSIVALVAVIRSKGVVAAKRGHMIGMVNLIFIQVILGFSNVMLLIPVSLTIIHLVVAQVLLIGLVSVYKELRPELRILPVADDGRQNDVDHLADNEKRIVGNA